MTKKNVLFITNEYPVLSSPTALAASFVIDYPVNEYEIFCLSIRNIHKNENSTSISLFCLTYEGKAYSARKKSKYWLRMNQIITIPLYPNIHPILQNQLNEKVLSICSQYAIDILVCISFPFETVVAGAYVKKRLPKIHFIPYLIDAYSCGTAPKYLPEGYSKLKRLMYEYKAIRNADGVIAMESAKDFYEKQRFECYHNFFYLNPAFFVKPREVKRTRKNNVEVNLVKVTYTGYLYLPDRDPTYAIRLFSAVKGFNIMLSFIGRMEVGDIIETAQRTFHGELTAPGFVDHDELETILYDADFLLHLGVSNGKAISGKIFEYMSYGKPIIALYSDPNEATLPYLEKYPYAICINTKNASFENALRDLEIFMTNHLGKVADPKLIEDRFYSSTPRAFWNVVNNIVEDR